MKKTIAILIATVCLLFSFCLSSCGEQPDSLSLYYFNTHIYIQTVDKPISNKTKTSLNDLFYSLQNEFDISNENSFVYKFNHADEGQSFALSKHGSLVMEKAKECYEFTDKLFDPTVYSLVELWQFAPNFPVYDFTPPTDAQITELLPSVDFDSVNFDKNTRTVTKTKANVKLDFGGILKGYAADLACEIMVKDGHDSGYISIGSSSMSILHADKLDVRHPRATQDLPSILSVNINSKKCFSVSSSGDYEKVYQTVDKNYCHIINPLNGYPTDTSVISVSILGIKGAEADALTTAGCLKTHSPTNFNNSQLITFLNKITSKHNGAIFFAVYNDGEFKQVITNANSNSDFTLKDKSYSVIKI